MEEAAESQFKVCNIHYKQMEKADRDNAQGQRAEDECRVLKTQYPNSPLGKQGEQMLRNIQEVLADKEFKTGDFYHNRGSFPAAANRMSFVSRQYPLYSGSDEVLWELADSYKHMGDRFEDQEADALTKLVRDYPLSSHLNGAKEMLTAMKKPVPQADPAAYARMKYELENRTRPGIVHRTISPFSTRPETYLSAKSGNPAMESLRPPVPVSVPQVAAGGQNGISDVSANQLVGNTDAFDKATDVRLGGQPAAPATTAAAAPAATGLQGTGEQKASLGANGQPPEALAATPATPKADAPLPTNHPPTKDQLKLFKKSQEKAAKDAKKKGVVAKPATATPELATPQPAATPMPAPVPPAAPK
jgi:outer membrane protein assembly factor BamD